MNRTEIRTLFENPAAYADKSVTVCGWVRTIRDSKALGFIELNDGGCFKNLQIVFEDSKIDNFKEVKIGDLSTGMKQKVSLVISLVHDPNIIVFDEPTNGLDVITAKTVTDFLVELKNQGKTIILSTHIFSLVEKLCDRVGIIIDGQMVVSDNLSELTKEKSLEDVFFDLYKEKVGEE